MPSLRRPVRHAHECLAAPNCVYGVTCAARRAPIGAMVWRGHRCADADLEGTTPASPGGCTPEIARTLLGGACLILSRSIRRNRSVERERL
jgi:hypothetical protein